MRGYRSSEAQVETRVHHPILLLRKALGYWDSWLGSERQAATLASFLQIARWTLDSQDENGGWEAWPPFQDNGHLPYSAMTQGEAMSVLVRAFSPPGTMPT